MMKNGWRCDWSRLIAALILPLPLSLLLAAGPVAAINLNPLAAIKGAVEAVVEDRSAGDIGADLKIKAAIVGEVLDQLTGDAISIGADV
nr:hypothetical protein [Alphaproteobacteria bacterium]